MTSEHGGLLADTHTWVLFSAIIFVAIAFIKGKKPILSIIDGRRNRIKTELEEAARLRKEAEALIKEYKQKHAEASKEAEKIINEATKYAETVKVDAEKKLEAQASRREELLIERIKRAEEAAVDEIRNRAADIAAEAAEKLVNDNISSNADKLIDEAIKELPKNV